MILSEEIAMMRTSQPSTTAMGVVLCGALCLAGCEVGAPEKATSVQGEFHVLVGQLFAFDERAQGAKAHHEDHEWWEFKGDDMTLRMAGRFDVTATTGMQSSLDLNRNNLLLKFIHPTSNQPITCATAQQPEGEIMRVIDDEERNSGHFKITFTTCRHFYDETAVTDLPLPLVVRGDFSGIQAR